MKELRCGQNTSFIDMQSFIWLLGAAIWTECNAANTLRTVHDTLTQKISHARD